MHFAHKAREKQEGARAWREPLVPLPEVPYLAGEIE